MRGIFPTQIAKSWDPATPCSEAALRLSSNFIVAGLADEVKSVSLRIAHGVRAMIYEEDGIFDPAARLILKHLPGTTGRRPVLSLATSAMIMAYDKYHAPEGLEASRIAGDILDSPKLVGTIPLVQRLSAEQQMLDRLGPDHPRGKAAMAGLLLGIVSDSNPSPQISYPDKQHSLDTIGQAASKHNLPDYEVRARQLRGVLELRHAVPPPQPQGSGLYFRR